MPNRAVQIVQWLFASDLSADRAPLLAQYPTRLAPRWIFLRAFGLICFSAFYALLFQAPGLIGPRGLLPAGSYLNAVKNSVEHPLWYAPTLFWLGSSDRALLAMAWIGIVASVLLVLNIWPRLTVAICLVAFMSFTGALQAFASYQSDGMLLGAAFLCLFFAPPGLWPGWGERRPPSRASLFLLQWLWFTIYFESGMVKLLSHDPEWRNLTAMDEYYQNGPLPTWIGWYAQHLPHWFAVGSAGLTLVLELGLVWMLFLPRRFRLVLFFIVTPWQIGIILTANYAFLNYLVLALGILLLDDKYLWFCLPKRLRPRATRAGPPRSEAALEEKADSSPTFANPPHPAEAGRGATGFGMTAASEGVEGSEPRKETTAEGKSGSRNVNSWAQVVRAKRAAGLWVAAICLSWIFYATAVELLDKPWPENPLPEQPALALQTLRIAESYGLFAVMTRARYEIEFQGSNDNTNWQAYSFCFKPQDPSKAPGIYAPYQPRFDWNLWFASLDSWQSNRFVLNAEERLLQGSPEVLRLFCGDPFPGKPPLEVRAVLWQYWFSNPAEKRQGLWWTRMQLGIYAPALERENDRQFKIIAMPDGQALTPRE